ncbi:hypothetical protein [Enterovibrio nigricans]|uniref:Uncharacterized protein n=1 Tax=Enterovibrio nigricans DSM 22720 TaxID=1121868 RepID=A0A1T4UVN2_9GAMM|nr:hypothetical protein [Enterovibrio nigricans]PKF50937.1 hypothetical protein AT251_07990 [Enterovibrio nigricans]SKA56752.1 hypothetical protein SAMN02745132_02635 [Enterovibrio nigricans DSM 22720]
MANQHFLDKITKTTLADAQTSLNLSESVAQIAALAPYIATSARPYQVQKEKQLLEPRTAKLTRYTTQLTDPIYSLELSSRVKDVKEALQQLMSNVEQELYIREDLMAQQFSLDGLNKYPFGSAFVGAFTSNPTQLSQGWIEQVLSLYQNNTNGEQERNTILPVFAALARGNQLIKELHQQNAFLLASIRAQSDRMAEYVNNIVLTTIWRKTFSR